MIVDWILSSSFVLRTRATAPVGRFGRQVSAKTSCVPSSFFAKPLALLAREEQRTEPLRVILLALLRAHSSLGGSRSALVKRAFWFAMLGKYSLISVVGLASLALVMLLKLQSSHLL